MSKKHLPAQPLQLIPASLLHYFNHTTRTHRSVTCLISRGLFEKPGTGMLFRNVKKGHITEWENKNIAINLFQVGSSINKFKATFCDDGYIPVILQIAWVLAASAHTSHIV